MPHLSTSSDSQPRTARAALPGLVPAAPILIEPAPHLRTARLVLRPLAESDRDQFMAVVSSSRAHLDRWAPLHRPGESDTDLFSRQLELTRAGLARLTAVRRAAFLHDGTLVGALNLVGITRGLQFEAHATWWIAAPYTSRGLAREGLARVIEHAFTELPIGLGLQRIFAGIRPDNAPSIALAEACGFRISPGPRASLRIDGQWVSHDVYARDAA